jgi:hypothetical protein
MPLCQATQGEARACRCLLDGQCIRHDYLAAGIVASFFCLSSIKLATNPLFSPKIHVGNVVNSPLECVGMAA